MAIGKISSDHLIVISKICEAIPVVSTLTILFQKYVLSTLENKEILKNHYYFYIQQRDAILLSIPVVNIAVVIFRLFRGDSTEANMKETLLNAVEKSPEVLSYETAQKLSLIKDPVFMQAVAKKNLEVLKHAEGFSADQSFMTELVRANVDALTYVGGKLRSNEEFWIDSLIQNGKVEDFLPLPIRKSSSFWLTLIVKDPTFVSRVPGARRSSSFFLQAIEKNAKVYPLVTEFLKDPAFLATAVAGNKDVLKHVVCEPAIYSALFSILEADRSLFYQLSPGLLSSRAFKFALVQRVPELVTRFEKEDREFYIDAAVANPFVAKNFSWFMGMELELIEDLILEAYKKNKEVLAVNNLRADKSFMLRVIAYDIEALKLPNAPIDDEEFMLQAIKINPKAMNYRGWLLQQNKEFSEKVFPIIDAINQ